MKAAPASIGARVVDSYPFSQGGTAQQALDLKADGVDCLVGYLGLIDAEKVGYVLDAGMAFMAVTLGGHYSGPSAVQQCTELGLPAGVTVWLDLEGKEAFATPPGDLMAKINSWANCIAAAGYMPGLYVGVPQPLTSDELWGLRVARYWRGQGSVRDRNNALAEPTGCGWCMTQMFPSHVRGGVLVDDDCIGQDYRGRVPTWAVAA